MTNQNTNIEKLEDLNEQYKRSIIRPNFSSGKHSKMKNFIKRTILKLVRWYYNPIFVEQGALNEKTIESLSKLINVTLKNDIKAELYVPTANAVSNEILNKLKGGK